MARSGIEWTSEIGILWESLMEFLLQVYMCCWCNFYNSLEFLYGCRPGN